MVFVSIQALAYLHSGKPQAKTSQHVLATAMFVCGAGMIVAAAVLLVMRRKGGPDTQGRGSRSDGANSSQCRKGQDTGRIQVAPVEEISPARMCMHKEMQPLPLPSTPADLVYNNLEELKEEDTFILHRHPDAGVSPDPSQFRMRPRDDATPCEPTSTRQVSSFVQHSI